MAMLFVAAIFLGGIKFTISACLDSDLSYAAKVDAVKSVTWKSYNVLVNSSDVVGTMRPFWKSTGFCPPEPHQDPGFFLGEDMQQNLIYIASIPGHGSTQVRMHWLLDLINASMPTDSSAPVAYNFSHLDVLLDRLLSLGLKPGFELMGNPFPRPLNFELPEDLQLWRNLVATLASRYMGRYGEDSVTQWNFESWNEPDSEDYGRNFTETGLCSYYDASADGLQQASARLRFGGPAENLGSKKKAPLAWALLDHIDRSGSRLDFLSVHEKGVASTPDIVVREKEALSRIRDRCPTLASKPCINDEADPLKNWALPLPWRADATYAAMLARLVDLHLREPDACGDLSSDNGFLSYPPQPFSQRTLLARFRMNESEPHVVFVRKPIHTVTGLLGKLGTRVLGASVEPAPADHEPTLGVVATSAGSRALSILVYYNNDSSWEPGVEAQVSIRVLLDSTAWPRGSSWAVYQLDNHLTNPYAAWIRQGCPPFPNRLQMNQLRANEEPRLVSFGSSRAGDSELPVELSVALPGAALLVACGGPSAKPAAPRDVRVHRVASNRSLVHWRQARDGCTSGYRVLFSAKVGGPYEPLGAGEPLFPSLFVDCQLLSESAACRGPGFLRVAARVLGAGRSALSRPVPCALAHGP